MLVFGLKKLKNSNIRKVLTTFAIFTFILAAGFFSVERITQDDDISGDQSKAIFGGRINESGYPFAGYSIGFIDSSKANICGNVLISDNTLLSAAHCISDGSTTYVGDGEYDYQLNRNTKVSEINFLEGWDGQNNEYDLAVLKLPDSRDDIESFAEIGQASIGCGYEVVGYGSTEIDDQLPVGERLRKSAELCVEDINGNLIYFRGRTGGICFGDSGSPVFRKDTNQVVGVISAIVTEGSNDYCSPTNKAIAVRLDTNSSFIENNLDSDIQLASIALCGQDCKDKTCAEGLVCSENNECQYPGIDSCSSSIGQYCSILSNVNCTDNNTCISNQCVESNVNSENFPGTVFTNQLFENIGETIRVGSQNQSVVIIVLLSVTLAIAAVALRNYKFTNQ